MHIALAPFELKPGVSEGGLLTASDRFQQEFASKQDGIIRRVLVTDSEGGYADLVFFRDLESIDPGHRGGAKQRRMRRLLLDHEQRRLTPRV
jgi:hypothetical protein